MPVLQQIALLAVLHGVDGMAHFSLNGLERPLRLGASVALSRAPAGRMIQSDIESVAVQPMVDKANVPYLASACVVSCALRGASDFAGQHMFGDVVSIPHVGAMATMGLLFSGLIGASWLGHLERKLGSGSSLSDVALKSACDFFVYAPVANSAYLWCVPMLTAIYSTSLCGASCDLAASLTQSTETLQSGFASAMQLEASMFLPYNLLAFRIIPAEFRPQTQSLMW